MDKEELIAEIKTSPQSIRFEQVMAVIAEFYDYTPSCFTNGMGDDRIVNEAGFNEGSCKIFAFARLNDLSKEQTLACFGQFYREDVLAHPDGTDHANIRNFMRYGRDGVVFAEKALKAKNN